VGTDRPGAGVDTIGELEVDQDEVVLKVEGRETLADEVDILEIEDDLDTGMHRVNVCPLAT
jgi:hypothetical protein